MASPLIYRKRLINAINTPGHHIVYIYGPAGFGKTTLAQHWMETETVPTVWMDGYSTSNPNDLFQDFLVKICERIPHLNKKFSPLLNLNSVTLENINEFAQILESDKSPFNIVVNSAEEIRRDHNDLSMAIVRLMPKHIKLILVTSTSPKSDFIQDAGINRFAVVGPDELRFNDEEIRQVAHDALPDLKDSDVKEIQQLTEGWPASIEIVISLLRGNPEYRHQLSTLQLKGKSQFSIEANRVLAKLGRVEQELLKKLSPLRSFSAEIAYEITKDIDVVRRLTLMSQDSIIVTQIEHFPPTFKIHPIFRDALIDELRRDTCFSQTVESVVANLLQQNEIRQATSILVEMGETLRLAEIFKDPEFMLAIGTSIQDSISRAAVSELREWTAVSKYLPVVGNLGKAVVNFYAEFLSGNLELAESQVKILESEINLVGKSHADIAKSWHSDVLVLKSMLAFAHGKLEENWKLAIEASKAKAEQEEDQSRHQINYLQLALWGAVITDNSERVQEMSKCLERLSGLQHDTQRNLMQLAMRSLIAAYEGRLIEAQNYLITPITSASHAPVKGFFGPYGTQLAQSILLMEAGKLQESLALLQSSAAEASTAKNYSIAIALLGRAAYLSTLLKNSERGLEDIETARKIIEIHDLSQELHQVVDMWEIRVRHLAFDAERVQELLKRCRPSYFVRSFQAAASISTGNFEQVKNLISTFDLKIPRQAITYHLFSAYTLKDSPSIQIKEISKALEIGSKHGYFHHFLTQRSDVMQQYISIASEMPTAFNERLARAAGEELNKMMISKNDSGEALTRREADILRHLATGLPLKDIAANLNISKNTIKTHLRNLYRKLGAEDRKDAVEKGKKLLKV